MEALFIEALAKPTLSERDSYLEQACQGDAQLRNRVEALLSAHENAEDFLQLPTTQPTRLIETVREGPGTVIGRYKLLEQIGEGASA